MPSTNASEIEQLENSINVWELVTGKKMACADVESPRKQHELRKFNVAFELVLKRKHVVCVIICWQFVHDLSK
jgi:hypothetical protein